jgi:hypothetical protein
MVEQNIESVVRHFGIFLHIIQVHEVLHVHVVVVTISIVQIAAGNG